MSDPTWTVVAAGVGCEPTRAVDAKLVGLDPARTVEAELGGSRSLDERKGGTVNDCC